MKVNYKNIAIAVAVTGLIGIFIVGSMKNENQKTAKHSAKNQAQLQGHASPITNDIEKTKEEAKGKIREAEAVLTGSKLKKESYTTSSTSVSTPIENPTTASNNIIARITALAANKYPEFEVTIWNQNAELASEGQIPYELALNGSFNKLAVSDCDGARKLSYYILEDFYKDSGIRHTLSRIMITIPNYLRVSLGASDGVPMAEDDSFSGPTNFWSVMEKMGLGENETGEMKNRTWGTYLTKCK